MVDIDEFQDEYLDTLKENSFKLEKIILSMEKQSVEERQDSKDFISLKRIIHSIKGSAACYELDLASTICHNWEDAIDQMDSNPSAEEFYNMMMHFQSLLIDYYDYNRGQGSATIDDLQQRVISGYAPESNSSDEKVLIVEPSKSLTNMLRKCFSELGIQVSHSTDSYEALGRLINEPFDALITERSIRPVDGLCLINMLRESKAQNSKINTYILSADPIEESDRPQGLSRTFIKGKKLSEEVSAEFSKLIKQNIDGINQKISSKKGADRKLSKIFYVDDDIHMHRILEMAMKFKPEVEIEYFTSGKEVLERLKTDLPDLILLDNQMPELDGPEVYALIKEQEKAKFIPIIFLTASSDDSDNKKILSLKPEGVIYKPIRPKKLYGELSEIFHS